MDHASPFGVADVLVTSEAEYVLTNTIEAPRMREEQTPDLEEIEHPWYEDEAVAVREAVGDAALETDFPLENSLDISNEIAPCVTFLTPTPWGVTGALVPTPQWRRRRSLWSPG